MVVLRVPYCGIDRSAPRVGGELIFCLCFMRIFGAHWGPPGDGLRQAPVWVLTVSHGGRCGTERNRSESEKQRAKGEVCRDIEMLCTLALRHPQTSRVVHRSDGLGFDCRRERKHI